MAATGSGWADWVSTSGTTSLATGLVGGISICGGSVATGVAEGI